MEPIRNKQGIRKHLLSTTWGFLGLLARLNVSTPLAALTELSKDFFKAIAGVLASLGVVSIRRLLIGLAA